MLAVLWDWMLRAATRGRAGLDEVLRAQVLQATRDAAKGDVVSAGVLLPAMVRRVTGVDLSDEIARHVDKGELPVLPEDAFGPCVRVVQVSRPVFDHGFDFLATLKAHGHLTGLVPGGPADRAGLHEGERLHFDETYGNDSSAPLTYGVDNADGTRRTVSYRPEGQARVTIQQLVLAPSGGKDAACVKGMLSLERLEHARDLRRRTRQVARRTEQLHEDRRLVLGQGQQQLGCGVEDLVHALILPSARLVAGSVSIAALAPRSETFAAPRGARRRARRLLGEGHWHTTWAVWPPSRAGQPRPQPAG